MKKALVILPAALFLLAFTSNAEKAIDENDKCAQEPECVADMLYYGTEAVQIPSGSPDADIPQDLLDQLDYEDQSQEKI